MRETCFPAYFCSQIWFEGHSSFDLCNCVKIESLIKKVKINIQESFTEDLGYVFFLKKTSIAF